MAGFKNLEDLVGSLSSGLVKLRAGELEPEELTPLVDDARELCDRLILLRFKAHEFAYEVRKKAPEGGLDDTLADRQPVRPFRIGAAYQTSLIDAIEEVSREQAEQAAAARRDAGTPGLFDMPIEPESEAIEANTAPPEPAPSVMKVVQDNPRPIEQAPAIEEIPTMEEADVSSTEEPEPEAVEGLKLAPNEEHADGEAPTSLAEQMERKAIGDLRTAFSLVEKYECIKGLFEDDAVLFDRVLEALDDAGDFQLALHWLRQHVPQSQSWDADDPTVMRFYDRIQRRYA